MNECPDITLINLIKVPLNTRSANQRSHKTISSRKKINSLNPTKYILYTINIYFIFTVDENIIGASNMQNYHGAVKLFFPQYCDVTNGLFSIALYKVITLDLICYIFGISSLLLFFNVFLNDIVHPTIAITVFGILRYKNLSK